MQTAKQSQGIPGSCLPLTFEVNALPGVEYSLPWNPSSSGSCSSSKLSEATDASHEAGYDALMTSLVLIHQLGHILGKKRLTWEQLDFSAPRRRGQDDVC